MATSYDLISARSSVQALSPTSSLPVEVLTIRTKPSGVMAEMWLAKAAFDAGTTGPILTTLAQSIETIIRDGKAIGGSPTTILDGNGLQQSYVTFVVAYTPPGGTAGQITTDVDVPVGLLSAGFDFQEFSTINEAEKIVDDAYANLVAAANG